MSQKVLKHIAISVRNYDRLAKLGHTPQSFDKVVSRVIDEFEEYQRIKKNKGKAVEAAVLTA